MSSRRVDVGCCHGHFPLLLFPVPLHAAQHSLSRLNLRVNFFSALALAYIHAATSKVHSRETTAHTARQADNKRAFKVGHGIGLAVVTSYTASSSMSASAFVSRPA